MALKALKSSTSQRLNLYEKSKSGDGRKNIPDKQPFC